MSKPMRNDNRELYVIVIEPADQEGADLGCSAYGPYSSVVEAEAYLWDLIKDRLRSGGTKQAGVVERKGTFLAVKTSEGVYQVVPLDTWTM